MATYQHILGMARQLDISEQLRLLEALAKAIQLDIAGQPEHSLLELQGLGQDIWNGLDIDQYIREERASWDG